MKSDCMFTMIEIKRYQKEIERFVWFRLLPRLLTNERNLKFNSHFISWFNSPMNYTRLMELPITLSLLRLQKSDIILDISSPKLLSFFLVLNGFQNLVISDIEDYFVKDFESFDYVFQCQFKISIFDARQIPFKNASFHKVFSVSAIEHIPNTGDIEVIREVARILKPGGKLILTLPSYRIPLEEWLSKSTFYWADQSIKDNQQKTFYQRRYTKASIIDRFSNKGLIIEKILFIAERPIALPQLDNNGMLLHNHYYIESKIATKISNKMKYLPMFPYFAHKYYSSKYHYLTTNENDPNCRQAAVIFSKSISD